MGFASLSLVVEILIGGCFSAIWIAMLINKLFGHDLSFLFNKILIGFELEILGTFVIIVSLYILGWISQYFCDIIFDNLFEKTLFWKEQKKGKKRNKKNENFPYIKKEDFYRDRKDVLQNASKAILDDIQFDRQLLRLSKQCCLNFSFIFIITLSYLNDRNIGIILTILFISLITILVSFLQWKKRYVSVMWKFKNAIKGIQEKND